MVQKIGVFKKLKFKTRGKIKQLVKAKSRTQGNNPKTREIWMIGVRKVIVKLYLTPPENKAIYIFTFCNHFSCLCKSLPDVCGMINANANVFMQEFIHSVT